MEWKAFSLKFWRHWKRKGILFCWTVWKNSPAKVKTFYVCSICYSSFLICILLRFVHVIFSKNQSLLPLISLLLFFFILILSTSCWFLWFWPLLFLFSFAYKYIFSKCLLWFLYWFNSCSVVYYFICLIFPVLLFISRFHTVVVGKAA